MKRIVISLDFELAWGVLESDIWKTREKKGVYNKLRYDFQTLLDYTEKLEIPLTIGCVGAMLQDRSDWSLDHLPCDYRASINRFADSARETSVNASDLMEMIRNCNVRHDVGSHTYTHIHAERNGASPSVLNTELLLANSTLQKFGYDGRSLIFPRDQVYPHDAMLSGPTAVARRPPESNLNIKKLLNFSPSCQVVKDEKWGGVSITGSVFLNWSTGWKSYIKKKNVKSAVNQALNSEGNKNCDYHFWLHPFNLSETKGLMRYSIDFLEKLSSLRDNRVLDIVTMQEFS